MYGMGRSRDVCGIVSGRDMCGNGSGSYVQDGKTEVEIWENVKKERW